MILRRLLVLLPLLVSVGFAADVYALRGLFGVFSSGLTTMTEQASQQFGLQGETYLESQYRQAEKDILAHHRASRRHPLILIGHSFGADNQIAIARDLNQRHIPVDLLVTLDAVNPSPIPPNVKRVLNFYEPHPLDNIPMLRGIPVHAENKSKTTVLNINVHDKRYPFASQTIHHANIDKIPGIQAMILKDIAHSL